MRIIKQLIANLAIIDKSHLSILAFHSIGESYPFSVRREIFLDFIDTLLKHGDIVSLETYNSLEFDKIKQTPPKRFFSITFDDGHRDNVSIAYDLIKRKIPFSLFINAALFNQDRRLCINDISSSRQISLIDSDFITLDEAKEISSSPYATIAPHGYRHISLAKLTDDQLNIDIIKTLDIFKENNFNLEFFAIPFGRVGRDFHTRDILFIKKHGFKPLSLSPTAIISRDDLVIPRIGLGVGDQYIWLEKAFGAGRFWKFFKEHRLG